MIRPYTQLFFFGSDGMNDISEFKVIEIDRRIYGK